MPNMNTGTASTGTAPYGRDSRSIALQMAQNIPDLDVRRAVESSLSGTATLNDMVKAFHLLYKLPILRPHHAREDFSHISPERLAMRFGLIVEEMMELFSAMDIRCDMNFYYLDEEGDWIRAHGDYGPDIDHNEVSEKELHDIVNSRCADALSQTEERDLPGVADACFDLKYVIIGFEYEVGIDPQFCANEGQASNMSKLLPDGTISYRYDGKVMKGPNYFRPDMRAALSAWGMKIGPAPAAKTANAILVPND